MKFANCYSPIFLRIDNFIDGQRVEIQDTQMCLVTQEISLSILFYSHRGHLNRVPETRKIYEFYWAGVRN